MTPANDAAYGYDVRGRLSQVTLAAGSGASFKRRDYGHDANGNRTLVERRVNATDTTAAEADSYTLTPGTNRLASIATLAVTRNLAYDTRGNLATETRGAGVTATTAYDGHGRLISYARTGEDSFANSYNGLGDRVSTARTPVGGGSADIRTFVTAPDGRVIGEYGTSATDVKAEFIWLSPEVGDAGSIGGDDGLGGYMPLAIALPTTTPGITQLNWVHGDHMGTPIVITDASGTAVPQPSGYYTPAFPGQSRTFADLYYNRYRDYDPTTGRYIQADPIGLAGGANPYLYANGNPLRYVDPTGETPWFLIPLGAIVLELGDQALDNWLNNRSILDKNCYNLTNVAIAGGTSLIPGFAPLRSLQKVLKYHKHHPIPKFLGGNPRQKLSVIPESVHKDLHQELRDILRGKGLGRPIGGRGGSSTDWARDFAQNPGSQRDALDSVLDASRNIDRRNGTNITQDVWNNIMNDRFRIDP